MVLTQRQINIIIGLILGDGGLEKNGNNVRLKVEHGFNQKKYLMWLYGELKNIISCQPRIVSSRSSKSGKIYSRWHFSTLSLECLNSYYYKFYKNTRKVVPDDIYKILISPLSLAVWYMDDGYKRNDCNALRISTDSFNYNEQIKLIRCLKSKFNIKCKLHKKASTWNIYIPVKSSYSFCSLIKPCIIPSMRYKLI